MPKKTPRKPKTPPLTEGETPIKLELWPIDRPVDYPKNARKWSQKAVDKVAQSLREFGFRQPIVVDREGVIIIGHLRRQSARQAGFTEVPVHVAADLSPAKVRALRLMDNRSHDEAEWDMDLLMEEMKELASLDLDLSLTGFDEAEFVSFVSGMGGLTDPDEVPVDPVQAVTRAGDLWILGDHRLLCGDCTDAFSVGRLMGSERAGLMNTDPPYGIGYDSADLHEHGISMAPIAGDTNRDADLQEFLEKAFRAAVECALLKDAAWYLWHAMLTQGFFAAAAAAAAHVILHRQIIWVKPILVFGRGQYHWKHELCFMGWVKGNQPPDYGDHTETTVWEAGSVSRVERAQFQHSSPKPVRLFDTPIQKHLKPREICYDPFAGTGPQFISAECLERRCFGLEIEVSHCDVIVIRWQNFTGKEATLEGDGRTFAQIAVERGVPNGAS